jgi:glycosyltransferase involved in cell wall biosynthesis
MHRILFDCERMKYPDTGLYHYCLNLGRYLEHHARLGSEEICFYAPPGEQPGQSERSQHLRQHPLHKFRMPQLQHAAIWHATYQNTHYMPFRDRRVKVVLSIHDLNFLYDDRKADWKKQKYLRHVQRLVDRADAIVCVSEFSRTDVARHLHTGKKTVAVIHNGTNLLDAPELGPRSYRPMKPFLFSIGVIHPKKNFHVLLPLLQRNTLELLIAGRPDDRDYLTQIRKQASRLGVSDQLHVLGTVSEKEKSWYFNHCEAFAFPSLSEGFGLPVVEAMSCGKPLFLSERNALPEIGGEVSFYFRNFEPEHMQQVFATGMSQFTDLSFRQRIRERSLSFNWHRAAKRYWDVYRSLY